VGRRKKEEGIGSLAVNGRVRGKYDAGKILFILQIMSVDYREGSRK
jgi:hypothetical protein